MRPGACHTPRTSAGTIHRYSGSRRPARDGASRCAWSRGRRAASPVIVKACETMRVPGAAVDEARLQAVHEVGQEVHRHDAGGEMSASARRPARSSPARRPRRARAARDFSTSARRARCRGRGRRTFAPRRSRCGRRPSRGPPPGRPAASAGQRQHALYHLVGVVMNGGGDFDGLGKGGSAARARTITPHRCINRTIASRTSRVHQSIAPR